MKQFGIKRPDQVYTPRPSAHVVLFDQHGRIFVVRHATKYFLPGGGVEGGESVEDALHREIREEIGWSVKIGVQLDTAGEYVHIVKEGSYINKVGHFFLGEIVDTSCGGTELDHEPMWVTTDEFEIGAAHESHVWAVRLAAKKHSGL